MQIHQVLVSVSPGDGITQHAFELRSLLRQIGPSEIFARNIHPGIAVEVIDQGTRLGFTFDDMLRYAGPGSPADPPSGSERAVPRVVRVAHTVGTGDDDASVSQTGVIMESGRGLSASAIVPTRHCCAAVPDLSGLAAEDESRRR